MDMQLLYLVMKNSTIYANQLSIDYSITEALSPEKRLLWCLGKTAMTVNGINKWKEAAQNRQNEAPIVSPTDASHDISVRDL